jgi:hypothetical protein
MLSIYDPLEDLMNAERFRYVPLRHMASELKEEYGYKSDEELHDAIKNTFDICCMLDIPINLHFRNVYIYEGNSLKSDWLLSDLASYLLLINGNAHNPNVAKARLYLISMQAKH